MRFLSIKKSFIRSRLLMDMTDIHSHILYDVDDGIKNYKDAVVALQWLRSNGVARLFLTPHVMSDFPKNTTRYLSEAFGLFVKRLNDDEIKDIPALKLGAEYMLEPAFEKHKQGGFLTFADRHILVETSYMMPPIGYISILEQLMEEGYSPILAHPERYTYMVMDDYHSLRTEGVLFQLNFLSLTGAYGRYAKEKALWLLENGLYKFTGSDFHNLDRHKSDFLVKSLKKKQIATLQCLIDNNKELW